MKIIINCRPENVRNLAEDLAEAIRLLSVAGPNSLLADSDEFWERSNRLTNKYVPEEEEDEE